MGIYKVQSNGKAPRGLLVGDQVVTGGGTYVITGVRGDGSYSSVLLDQQQTTRNFRGKYDSLGSVNGDSGGNAANVNGGASGGAANVNGGASGGGAERQQLEQQYLRLLEQTLSGASGGNSNSGNSGSGNSSGNDNSGGRTLSFAQALQLASDSLAPGYSEAYQQAAQGAQQRLDRAGLHDTLYGQALAAQAQNEVSEDLNAAVYQLALQLTQDSADYTAQQQSTALKYLLELLKLKTD